jgi:Zn-dependent membrane protease YugP
MWFWSMWILLPGIVFALWAQAKVRGSFARYSRVRASCGLTGAQLAADLLARADLAAEVAQRYGKDARRMAGQLAAVQVRPGQGTLTDHYDPSKKALFLSPEVYHGDSLAALGIAAHETGHAMQEASGYPALVLRTTLVPMANIGSKLAFPLFIIGIIASLPPLMTLGILFYAAAVVFTVVTLPVEFNASRRALALLEGGGYLTSGEEMNGARAVLNAAALTYVAAALMAILTLLRLLILRGSRD